MESIGYVYFKDTRICKITYKESDLRNFEFIFEPDYSAISTLKDFRGIQGINLELRQDKYLRRNMMPSFIYEHTPIGGSDFRENLNLAKRIEGLDVIEFLCKTKLQYFGDQLHIESK